MPNAKQTLTTLLRNIDAAINRYPEQDIDLFRSNYNGALDLSTSYRTQIYGHNNSTIFNCLRSALQAVSEGTSSPETAQGAWNPMIAAVFSTLEQVVLELDDDDLSSRVRDVNIDTNKSSGHIKKITTTGGSSQRPSQKSEPMLKTPPTKVVQGKPTTKVSTPLSTCPNDVVLRVRKGVSKFENTPVFKNLPHVKCVKPNCDFCVKLWIALDLSKCSEVKCHRKESVCNRDGWYAHVFPTMWLAAKKDHDAGLPFPGLSKYAPKPAVDGTNEHSSPTSNRKRNLSYAQATVSGSSSPMEYDPASPAKTSKMTDEEIKEAEDIWFHNDDDPRLDIPLSEDDIVA
jgi:hypothetical protein